MEYCEFKCLVCKGDVCYIDDYWDKNTGIYNIASTKETGVMVCVECQTFFLQCELCSDPIDDIYWVKDAPPKLKMNLLTYTGFEGIVKNKESDCEIDLGIIHDELGNKFCTKSANLEYIPELKKYSKPPYEVCITGPDGGLFNYWICEKCNRCFLYSDK